ncbi:hypothetical protein [Winogradskya humida]|uniref:Uncharacterized protein n=1 Tax=Winogradskya humida TaxID=113566 RepID=A0ABQ4A3H5_9ACTN|nr:hypothetical protein [Actinoplanes humidus]GIE25405.1 hypothetical protein Ahu01nite_085070 [Actinoplanes humidus]
MSLSDDLSPPRRPLFFPVVIATVFLAIIGISAGFALGTEHSRYDRASQQSPADQGGVPDGGGPTENAPAGIECPPEMQATARRLGFTGTLTQILRVRADETGTSVWICQDPAGSLYYQANKGGQDAKWIEGETALFLSDVSQDGDTYTATAKDGATFVVNDEELRVRTKTGQKYEYAVHPE